MMRTTLPLPPSRTLSVAPVRLLALVVCACVPVLALTMAGAQETADERGAQSATKQARGGSFEHPIARDYYDRAMRAFEDAEDASERLENEGISAEARSRIERSRREAFREAARLLQRILDKRELRDGVFWDSETERFDGISATVRRTLLAQGELAVQAYREHVDSDASHAVRRARATGDAEALAEVVIRYPFATAALPAGIEAARVFWEAGEVDRAAALARRLLERDDLNEAQGGLLVALAAYAYGLRGQVYEASVMQQLAEARFSTARVATGRTTRDLRSIVEEQYERASERASGSTEALAWPSQASDATGQHRGLGSVEPDNLKWRGRFPHPTRTGRTEHYSLGYRSFGLPRRFPAANESVLVVPNRTGVMVYNLFDERQLWSYDVPIETPERSSRANERRGEFWLDEQHNRDPHSIDTATVADNEVYVPLETPMQYERHDPLGVGGNRYQNRIWGTSIISFAPRRRLYSFDARTGEIRWKVGASWEDRERPIHETLSYTTAPLVLGERVYASAAKVLDQNAHVFVVAFDREPQQQGGEETQEPEVQWKTKIGSGLQETNLFGRPTREPVPSALAYQEHRLFVSTNIGAVTALDALTGEQLWSFPYDRIRFVPPVELRNHYRENTWFNMPPVVHDGRVYVAPTDSAKLYALDAETGKPLWELPWQLRTPRDRPRYLLGVHGDYLYWVGERYLFRTHVDRPRVEHFDLTRSLRSSVTGRPIIVEGVLHAATNDHSVLRFDLERRRHLRTVHRGIGVIGGNLALSNGVMIAANDRQFGVAYDWESLIRDLQERERARPDDPRIKLRIADISRQRGEQGQEMAIEYYEQVLELTEGLASVEARTASREAHHGLLSLWMEAFEQAREVGDAAAQERALERAQYHARTPEDGISLQLLRLRHLRRHDRAAGLTVLEELREQYGSFRYDFPDYGRMRVEQFALIEGAKAAESLGRHARAIELWQRALERYGRERLEGRELSDVARERIAELIQIAGREAYTEIERRAEEAFEEARARQNAPAALSVARRFPNSRIAPQALLARARWGLARAAGDANGEPDEKVLAEVIDVLRRVRDEYSDSAYRPEALLLLARSYATREMYHAARSAYRQLARDYAGETIQTGEEAVEVTPYVQRRLADPVFAQLLGEAPLAVFHRTPLELAREELVGSSGRIRLIKPGGDPGPFRNHLLMIANHRLVARNAKSGEVLWENPDIITYYAAAFINQRLAIVGTNGLFVIEPESGEVLERVNLGFQVSAAQIRDGFAALIMREQIDSGYRFHVGLINVETGEVNGELSQPFGDVFRAEPILAGDRLLVYARGSQVVELAGFDVRDVSEPRYLIDSFPSLPRNEPLLIDESRFVLPLADGTLQIRSVRTGGLLHSYDFDGRIGHRRLWTQDGKLLFSDMQRLIALDLRDEEAAPSELWQRSFGSERVNHNSFASPGAFFCVREQRNTLRVAAHDLETGEPLWERTVLDDLEDRYLIQRDGFELTENHLLIHLRGMPPRNNETHQLVLLLDRDSGEVMQRVEFTVEGHAAAAVLAYGEHLHLAYEYHLYTYVSPQE